MNKLYIIGNLTRDPELRTTASGINVCNMTVAVNRRRAGNDPETDFFGVSVWRGLGESCAKYLRKGAKVCVIGAVGVRTYQTNSGGRIRRIPAKPVRSWKSTPMTLNSCPARMKTGRTPPPLPGRRNVLPPLKRTICRFDLSM